jgi:hypothetical protein
MNHPEDGDVQASEEVLMSPRNIDCAQAEALFVSAVQPSDRMTTEQIRAAVDETVQRHGMDGCAAIVAYEFGEHPETAVVRMRWANSVVSQALVAAGRIHTA